MNAESAPEYEYSEVFTIVNELGLHARAATKLVQLAGKFACEMELEKDGNRANAKSVMGVLLLCGGKGAQIRVIARGGSQGVVREAVEAIGKLIASRFGEEK